jgi:hypothetical protein
MGGEFMQLNTHISDLELVMAADGELPQRRLAQVRSHLEACWSCRTRSRELDGAIGTFVELQNSSQANVPPADGPRALLRARMDALANQPSPRTFPRATVLSAGAGIAAVLVLVAGMTIAPRIVRHREEMAGLIPNTRLTPGSVFSTDERNVCASSENAKVIPAALGEKVFEEYGIRSPHARAYELDYLIAPELGGADDIRNFWPQPYSEAVWNSHVKDALEDRLHDLVCSGRISLATAQHDIASDWVAAYKKYFNTSTPLPLHYAFAKDMPWDR